MTRADRRRTVTGRMSGAAEVVRRRARADARRRRSDGQFIVLSLPAARGVAGVVNEQTGLIGARTAGRVGPINNQRQWSKIDEMVRRSPDDGAEFALGGSKPESLADSGGFYYAPTILDRVSPDLDIVRNEVFGPVVVRAASATSRSNRRIASGRMLGGDGATHAGAGSCAVIAATGIVPAGSRSRPGRGGDVAVVRDRLKPRSGRRRRSPRQALSRSG